jgi:hypothetical protein
LGEEGGPPVPEPLICAICNTTIDPPSMHCQICLERGPPRRCSNSRRITYRRS